MIARPYSPADSDAWDEFCAHSLQGTLLHTRRFLSYHADRFIDRSLILEDDDGKWAGVFPAALDPNDSSCVVSHPGITYGGVVHQGSLRGERMVEGLTEICRHYRKNHGRVIYKAVPRFYQIAPAEDDLYALFRLSAIRTRCDLSSTIDLASRLPISQRRRRGLAKSRRAGVALGSGFKYLTEFWEVLSGNLASKHAATPVHTLEEITRLSHRFPDRIRCVTALVDGRVVAGILLFITRTCHHAQYIASSNLGYEISALDYLFEQAIETAVSEGIRWFNFGISTEKQGTVLNRGLHQFKSEFGSGGMVHEFYELHLE